jgi:hypothetical protein
MRERKARANEIFEGKKGPYYQIHEKRKACDYKMYEGEEGPFPTNS